MRRSVRHTGPGASTPSRELEVAREMQPEKMPWHQQVGTVPEGHHTAEGKDFLSLVSKGRSRTYALKWQGWLDLT